jgi:Histidine kinase
VRQDSTSHAGHVRAMDVVDAAAQIAEPGFGRRLAGLVRVRWRQVTTYIVVLTAVDAIRNYSLHSDIAAELFASKFAGTVALVAMVVGGSGVLGTFAAEAAALRGVSRAVATVVLAFVGAALGIGLLALAGPDALLPAMEQTQGLTLPAFVLRCVWYYAATGILFAAYFAVRDRDAATARLAHAAELERGSVQRAVMESRLKVVQARVEPELLFDVLADVQRLYAIAPQKADALIDDLIVYLRAALPQMRGHSSTLGREAALAAAYVKVTPAARDGTLAYAQRIPDALSDLPFPPMVLLPLVHAAADARARTVALAAAVEPGDDPASAVVAVTVAVPGGLAVAGWSAERLTALRDIVASYYGEATTFETLEDTGRNAATLRVAVPRALIGSAPAAVR